MAISASSLPYPSSGAGYPYTVFLNKDEWEAISPDIQTLIVNPPRQSSHPFTANPMHLSTAYKMLKEASIEKPLLIHILNQGNPDAVTRAFLKVYPQGLPLVEGKLVVNAISSKDPADICFTPAIFILERASFPQDVIDALWKIRPQHPIIRNTPEEAVYRLQRATEGYHTYLKVIELLASQGYKEAYKNPAYLESLRKLSRENPTSRFLDFEVLQSENPFEALRTKERDYEDQKIKRRLTRRG